MRGAIAALLLVIVAGCQSPVVAPIPSPTTSPDGTATSIPLPTGPRHVNEVLGYAVTLPPPWRVSDCQSSLSPAGSSLGRDTFTWRTVAEEQDLGGSADAGLHGALNWVIGVDVQLTTDTPADYAKLRGGSVNDKVDVITIDGRPAVRVIGDFGTFIYVTNAGRMYTLNLRRYYDPGPPSTDAVPTLAAIARSFAFVTPAARPIPTAAPTLSPAVETIVDAVTAGFAASDADRLRELMPPKCWIISGGYPGGSTLLSREKMAALLRSAFAQGLKVTVETRPIATDSPIFRSPFWVWSKWSAYGTAPVTPASTVQLRFDQIEGRWYWSGALFNAPR